MSNIVRSRKAWDNSVSARAYNPGWWPHLTPEKEPALWEELWSILEEEKAISQIPGWASEIAGRMMELPMCGYYAYPANVIQIIDAISAEKCPDVVMRCYTVDSERKILLSYYVFCLDAWLKDAPLPSVVAELSLRDSLGKDWPQIALAIYQALSDKTEIKAIALERLIHRLRWWIKSLVWSNDRRDRFLLDVYSGDIRGDLDKLGAYGNPPYGDPYFIELNLLYVKEMEERILEDIPDGKKLLERIHGTWLCAPKVFRYLEKLIIQIGAIGSNASTCDDSPILQCEDTYPDFDANYRHYTGLVQRLKSWMDGREELFPSFGLPSPITRWLVHLLWHKLVFQATYEENFSKLVGKKPHGKSGLKKPMGLCENE